MSLYIDLTEFLASPIRTGIQRVVGEICRCLPPDAATPIRLEACQYVSLSGTVIGAIGEYFSDTERSSDDLRRMANQVMGPTPKISANDTVLEPEVFFQRERIAFFRGMSDRELARHRFVVYDLLPLTHPQFFPEEMPLEIIYGYFDVLRRATNSGFISNYSRDAYHKRFKRTEILDGLVLPLGADALGPKSEQVSLKRAPHFSVIGTIEPRKNHELILDAFEPLLGKVEGLTLSFIGKMGWVDPEFTKRVHALAAKNSSFRFFSAPTDGPVRQCIEESRATIYVSAAEGYGLPPVESLWVGTPVIASNTVPSLEGLGTVGIHRVDPLNAINLRRAILAFLDDGYARRKTQEAMSLTLPTWQSFGETVLEWCSQKGE